jgi:lipopolysaccharide biosynthesis glycosyltransferase
MLTSLFENNKELKFHIFVFSEIISVDSQDKLLHVAQHYHQEISFQTVSTKSIKDFKIHAHASLANYFRLLAFSQLPPEINKVLYLDVDLLVLKSINKLWNIDLDDKLLAAVPEQVGAYNNERLEIPTQYPYFNSGVMLVNIDLWKTEDMSKKTLDFIEKNPEKIHYWDQDALNATCYDNCIYLDKKWNVQTHDFDDTKNKGKLYSETSILHFTGMSKPWHYINKHPYKKVYYRYLKKTPWKNYKPEDKTIGNFLRKYKFTSSIMSLTTRLKKINQ